MWRRVLAIIVVLVAVMAIAAWLINSVLVDDDLVHCQRPGQDETCQVADVIVAVSGGDTAGRANKAIEMYQAGWAKKIVFSGDSADPDAISNAEAMRQIAVKAGIPVDNIYLDEKSRDTKENARNTVQILNKLQAKRVILVSSPYHLRRVKLNFQAVDSGLLYQTAAANDANWGHWYLTISGWVIAIKELAGIAELGAGV